MAAFHQTARPQTLRFRTFRKRRRRRTTTLCSRPQKWEGDLQVTEQEQEQLLSELKTFLHANNTAKGEKPPKKGLFSKVVVALCILIVIAYTSICLLMQWAHGMQPEPQLTISLFAFISAELMSLAAIKRNKDKNQ